MAKRSSRRLSKKGLIGLKRVTRMVSGKTKRVFIYRGIEYDTLRDVIVANKKE